MFNWSSAKHVARGLLLSLTVVLILTGVVQLLEFHGLLSSANGKILDWLLSSYGSETAGPILTAEIDDLSYQQCFAAGSPLKPDRVIRVLDMLYATRPAVMGVDIITDAAAYQAVSVDRWKNVVWIANGEEPFTPSQSILSWVAGRSVSTVVRPGNVLGRPAVPAEYWGLPVLPADEDAKIRRVYQRIGISSKPAQAPSDGYVDSWALNIARRYCSLIGGCKTEFNDEEAVYVVYGAKPPGRFYFRDLFHCSSKGIEKGALFERFAAIAPGRILLVGGTFGQARDTYDTPAGRLPGLVISAYVVQSEMDGRFMKEEHRPIAILLDLGIGMAIVLIFEWVRRRKYPLTQAAWMSTVLVLAAVAYAWFVLGKEYIPGFVGIVLGVMAHQIIGAIELEHE